MTDPIPNRMTDKDRAAAAKALVEWFKSQDIKPSDGAIIMCDIIAYELVIQHGTRIGQTLMGAMTVSELILENIKHHFQKEFMEKKGDCQS